jgi:O-antigen/teichoic acid export membrane protein
MSGRFLKNTLYGSLTALSTTLGGFVVNVIVARLLGVSETGSYTFAIWIVAISSTLTGAGLPFTLTRYLPEIADRLGATSPLELARFLLTPSLMLNAVPTLLAGSYAIWLALNPISDAATVKSAGIEDPVCWMLIGLCCSTQAIADYAKGYLRGVHHLDRVARLSTGGICIQLVFMAIGTAMFGLRGSLAGYFLGGVLPIIALRDLRGIEGHASVELRRRISIYARYRWASEIASAFVFSRVEVFFLQLTATSPSVGLFAAALTISNLAAQGPLMLTWGLLPHFTEQFSRNDLDSLKATYATATRLLAFLVFPCCFGLAAILPALLPVLYGTSFSGAVPAAAILVLGGSLTATSAIGTSVIWAMERSHIDLYFGLIGAAFSVLVGFPLIAHFGLLGAAVARVATQGLVVGLGIWYIANRLGFSLPWAGLARLAVSAAFCALIAHSTLSVFHGILGLPLAIGLGAGAYILAVSITGALDDSDVDRMSNAFHRLPQPLGSIAGRFVSFAFG